MTTATEAMSSGEAQQRDDFAGRLFAASLQTAEVFTIAAGDQIGYYQALADDGPLRPADLAARTGTAERYAREWLEQQAVAGILEVEGQDAAPGDRRYRLPPGHAEVLLNEDSLSYLTPLLRVQVTIPTVFPSLLEAYRTGGGVPYADFGAVAREGQAALNRPRFLHQLASEWLPAIPDVHARLRGAPPARLADIGCGGGWSSIAIARAYPGVEVDGFDVDEPSIEMARVNAAAADLDGRVRFHVRDAADPGFQGRYDLVTFFECVHDMARPVEALRSARGLLPEEGRVLVVDERVGDTFTAPGDEVERFIYAWSTLFCLPASMAEPPSAATGAVMRSDTLRRYAIEAGFREVEIAPIEDPFWRFYLLRP
jgi:SAM-dependent methyltransferase